MGSVLPRPEGLREGAVILDIGAGLRPMPWYMPLRHICVEPFGPYADQLEAGGYEVLRMTARMALHSKPPVDAIYMLDVIEHMERAEGEEVLDLAAATGAQRVIFTPDGFSEQTHDAWGLGGEYWQTHRSGWTPNDFPGWRISHFGPGFMAVSP